MEFTLREGKTFNDPIHGHIDLSSLSVKIIDTPQYQRLREISQLGGVYYVFPGAASKRFEHCIGVAHLARTFVTYLRKNQPELNISDADVLCVEIAGLCHDLGHGPFSHMFDGRFLPHILHNHSFIHEHASIGIFDLLIDENQLLPEFYKHGLNEDDIHFIKELILGDVHEAPAGFKWKGRGKDKTFLYDIVANKRNGIDVDKFDYFARDCHVLGITKSFDCYRLMKFAMVHSVCRGSKRPVVGIETSPLHTTQGVVSSNISRAASYNSIIEESIGSSDGNSSLEVCFHVKEAWNICELFHTRYALHKRAYQHKVSGSIELMITEAFIKADPYLFFEGKDGKATRMSECVNDFHAYWRLGDFILKQIECAYDPQLHAAKHIIHRLRKRDLFACAAELLLSPDDMPRVKQGADKILQQILDINKIRFSNSHASSDLLFLDLATAKDDLFCSLVKMGYGKGNQDPVSEMTSFYKPNKDTTTTSSSSNSSYVVGVVPIESLSRLAPREYEETYIRLFCRYKCQVKAAKQLFSEWASSEVGWGSPRKKAKTVE